MKYFLVLLVFLSATIFLSCSDDESDPSEPGEKFISLISPNGGEIMQVGASYIIKWDDNISENVTIEIFRGISDPVTSFENISSIGSYQFTVPINWVQAADYRIKVISVQDTSTYDLSDDFFEVAEYVSDGNNNSTFATDLTIPHTGDYAIYSSGDIDWYRVFLNSGDVYYFENTSPNDFDSAFEFYGPGNLSGTDIGTYAASNDDHGDTLQPYIEYFCSVSGYYYLRVAYYADKKKKEKQYEVGYYTLTIRSNLTGDLFLSEPNGGEVWMTGTGHNIYWTDENSSRVDIDLYKDGIFNSSIASSVLNSGNYYWNLPTSLEAGAGFTIIVSDSDDNSINDESNYPFCISENVNVNIVGDWSFNPYGKQVEYLITFNLDGTLLYSNGVTSYPGVWTRTGNGIRFDIIIAEFEPYCIGIVTGDTMSGTWYQEGSVGDWSASRLLAKVK
jgi:hypothetical protein